MTLVGDFDRPNLTYRVLPRHDLLKQVCEVLDRHAGEAGIIYCLRRRDVDELAASLQEARRQGGRLPRRHDGRSSGRTPRRRSPANAATWSWRRSRSAWASTAPTCVSSARGDAQVAGALPAGDRPGRPRRPGGGVRAAALRGRLPVAQVDAGEVGGRGGGRPGVPAQRPPSPRRHGPLRPRRRLPSPGPGGAFRPDLRRPSRAAPATSAWATPRRWPGRRWWPRRSCRAWPA